MTPNLAPTMTPWRDPADLGLRRAAGLAGLAGGLLFFAGDMLMYGSWGDGAGFVARMAAAVRQESLDQLYLGGLVGPFAACLCVMGFWHIQRNLGPGMAGRLVFGLGALAMAMLGAVHVLWVTKGLVLRECVEMTPVCTNLKGQIRDYWNLAYDLGVGPAYLACALLAGLILVGRSAYPRWTLMANPALSLLLTPWLVDVPAPWGAPLVGGDANLFIALFFAVSIASTWRADRRSKS